MLQTLPEGGSIDRALSAGRLNKSALESTVSDETTNQQYDPAAERDPGNADRSLEKVTSASGRLPNDPGPGATGGGVNDTVAENLAQQQRQPDETLLTDGEAESNKRVNQ
jgi:hypothetical protein